jgi:ferric-dicitrate binding protein FerR (iron transport regulator)
VRAYPEDGPQLDVVVAEGAVVIAPVSGRDSLVLRASEAGRVTADGELRAEHGVDVDVLLSWTEGRLEFKNVPLRDVVPVLARWYDAEIRLGDEQLGVYPITANLTGERVGEAVDAIARVINARVVKRGSTLLLIRNLAR